LPGVLWLILLLSSSLLLLSLVKLLPGDGVLLCNGSGGRLLDGGGVDADMCTQSRGVEFGEGEGREGGRVGGMGGACCGWWALGLSVGWCVCVELESSGKCAGDVVKDEGLEKGSDVNGGDSDEEGGGPGGLGGRCGDCDWNAESRSMVGEDEVDVWF
jgi:hypothetical protein